MKLGSERSTLGIRATPRSSRPGIGEWKADPGGRPFLEIRVTAAPADGAANDEIIRMLAKALGLSRSSLEIVSGQTSRLKRISVPLAEDEVRLRLSR